MVSPLTCNLFTLSTYYKGMRVSHIHTFLETEHHFVYLSMQEAALTYIIGLTPTNPTPNLLSLIQKAATTLQLS